MNARLRRTERTRAAARRITDEDVVRMQFITTIRMIDSVVGNTVPFETYDSMNAMELELVRETRVIQYNTYLALVEAAS